MIPVLFPESLDLTPKFKVLDAVQDAIPNQRCAPLRDKAQYTYS
jgi:hypothetical protein